MAQFSINDQTRRVRAVVSGTNQQEFSVAFQSNATTDIEVFVEGTQKTEGTHYDIKATTGSSAANGLKADGTCVVKFRHDASAGIDHRPTQNQVVTIISNIALARTSVYTSGGNITADALESDFDTITMQMAEREEAASRALTAPKFDPTDINMTLPDKDTRKGKTLGFNATTGNPEALPPGDITDVTAGTGLSGGGTAGAVTLSIDSTVATLSGTQTLTNKSIDAAQLTGTIDDARIPVAATDSAGLMSATDKAKLDAIEASATADQTAAEIRTLVGSASDSNVFTDADHSKLDGIEASATADQTASEIKTAYESNSDTNAFTDADHSKLDGIEASATADQTAAEIRTLVESATDSNVFTDNDHSKLDGIEASATADQTASEILTSVKTVDGTGSGLDADLLDGQQGSYYTSYADTAVSNLVDSAPSTLDTLNELAAALGDDANFSTTVTNSIATKLPLAGGTMTGNIAMSGTETVDGRDLSVDGAKLDSIEASATADQTAAEIRTLVESASDSNVFTDADHTKLNAIEASADVTDATNVTAAGALMDSEVTNLTQVKAFDASDYATAAQGTTADAAMPKAGGTFTGDVTFTGDNYNVVFDKSDDALEFADNASATFGAGADLRLFHNGSISYIQDAGTGGLRIIGNSVKLMNAANSETMLATTEDGAVELYYDNSKKLETTSAGIKATGDIALEPNDGSFRSIGYGTTDNTTLVLAGGGSSGVTAGNIELVRSGNINIDGETSFRNAGATATYAQIKTSGVTLSTDVTFTGDNYNIVFDKSDDALEFADNAVAAFGAGNDLKIYHNGNHSFIREAGTGNLQVQASNLQLQASGGETYLTATANGAVELYHDNAKKLETTSGGVDVTGDLTASGDVTTDEVFLGSSTDHKVGKVNHTYGDGIGLTTDSGTVTIGQGNSGFVHYVNSNSVPHWFNQTVYTNGNFGIYSDTGSIFWENNRGTTHEVTLTTTTPTGPQTITLPDATGEVVLKDSSDTVTISSTANDGPILVLKSDDPGDVADFNTEGTIKFFAENSASESIEYANIRMLTGDVTDGTEDGWIYFTTRQNAAFNNTAAFSGTSLYMLDDSSQLVFFGWGGTSYNVTLTPSFPSASRTITLPDATGTVALENGNAVLLNTTTVSSGVSSVDFGSSLITDDFDNYLLVVEDLTVSAATSIRLRLGTANSADGTANIYNANVQWRGRALTTTTNNTQNFSAGGISASAIIMGGGNQDVGTAATESANFTLQLQNLRSTTLHKTISGVTGSCYMTDTSGTNSGVTYVCSLRDLQFAYQNTSAVNFLRIYDEDVASQISGGTFSLYGLKT